MGSEIKMVVGLSGGMDSTTLMAHVLQLGHGNIEVIACTFEYGSKHNKYEIEAAFDVIAYYRKFGHNIRHIQVDLTKVGVLLQSNLMLGGGEIPEGHYEHESMKATVVPGRNLIFASVMAGIAESNKANTICLGVHSGDHHIYPDCRPDFIESLRKTISFSTDNTVRVATPFLSFTKEHILKLGYSMNVNFMPPYYLTRTCYKDQKVSCGKCGSCQERLEAYSHIGMTDPILYE